MKRIKSLLQLDLKLYKLPIITALSILAGILLLTSLNQPFQIRSSLYDYRGYPVKPVLSNRIADRPEKYVDDLFFSIFFYLILAAGFLLSMALIYRNYMESKSFYTLMRLPLPSRYLFAAKYFPGFFVVIIGYMTLVLSLLLYCGVYLAAIPGKCMPDNVFYTFMHSEQVTHLFPWNSFSGMCNYLSMLLLVPATGLLAAVLERSRKQGVIGLLVLFPAVITISWFLSGHVIPVFLAPSMTMLTICTGIDYIKKVQIV